MAPCRVRTFHFSHRSSLSFFFLSTFIPSRCSIAFEILDLFDWQTTIAGELDDMAKSAVPTPQRDWRKFARDWKELFDVETLKFTKHEDEPYLKSDFLLRKALDVLIHRYDLAFMFKPKQLEDLCSAWRRLEP